MALTLTIESTWDGQPAPSESVTLALELDATTLLVDLDAPWHRDPAPSGPPGRRMQLWEHEAVELFIAGPGEQYTEIELGPFGHFLVLRLDGVRRIASHTHQIEWSPRREAGRWTGRAVIPRELLPDGPLRMNAYAVHGAGEQRRYLAAFPPGGAAPDFHVLDSFQPVDLGA